MSLTMCWDRRELGKQGRQAGGGEQGGGTLTLVEIDVEMAQWWEGEHLDQVWVFVVESLAHRGEFVLGELPMFPLCRFPVVGRHFCFSDYYYYSFLFKTASAPQGPRCCCICVLSDDEHEARTRDELMMMFEVRPKAVPKSLSYRSLGVW